MLNLSVQCLLIGLAARSYLCYEGIKGDGDIIIYQRININARSSLGLHSIIFASASPDRHAFERRLVDVELGSRRQQIHCPTI
jgi:hypothetical protein